MDPFVVPMITRIVTMMIGVTLQRIVAKATVRVLGSSKGPVQEFQNGENAPMMSMDAVLLQLVKEISGTSNASKFSHLQSS